MNWNGMAVAMACTAIFTASCGNASAPPGGVGNGNAAGVGNGNAQGAGAESEQKVEVSGVISDSMCGPSHAAMLKTGSMGTTDATCTLECVKAGSHFVIVVDSPESARGKIYRISNPENVRGFAGMPVRVEGSLNQASKALSVRSIAARQSAS